MIWKATAYLHVKTQDAERCLSQGARQNTIGELTQLQRSAAAATATLFALRRSDEAGRRPTRL